MSAEQFVKNFAKEKANILDADSDGNGSSVESEIKPLNLGDEQQEVIQKVLDNVVTDTLYSVLMGLDRGICLGISSR